MKKEELWAAYVAKNPSFEGGGNVTMSAAGLKKMFDQTYERAHQQGVKNGKTLADMMHGSASKSKSKYDNFFDFLST